MIKRRQETEADDYFEECINVDPERIQGEFITIPAAMGYWGERAAVSLKVAKTAELERKRGEARAWLAHKAKLDTGFGKAPTVKDIEAAVTTDPDVYALQLAEIEAEASAASERARYMAVQSKKDVLQSMGAMLRSEMERDPMVRAKTGLNRGAADRDF